MKELQIQVCSDRKQTKNEYLLLSVTYLFFMISCMKIFCSGFEVLAPDPWLLILSSAAVGTAALLVRSEKIRTYLLPAGIAGILLLFLAGFSYSRNGISLLANEFLTFLTGKTGKIYLDFPAVENKGAFYTAFLFGCFFALILQELFYRRKQLYGLIFAVGCLYGCAVGFFTLDGTLFFLFGSVILLLFTQKMHGMHWKGVQGMLTAFLCIAVVCSFAALLSSAAAGEHFSTKYITRDLKEKIHQAQYDTGTNAMPEGNLRNLGYFHKTEEEALILSSEKPQKFYLRGMTGEIYTGNAWESLSDESYIQGEDLFYWLHKNDFYGQTAVARAMKTAGIDEACSLSVTNVSACKKLQYLPYGLADTKTLDADSIGDQTAAFTDEVMEYTYFSGSLPQWYEAYVFLSEHEQTKNVQEHLRLEESYREYVYENDLQLTNTAVGVFERIFGTETSDRTFSQILTLIRETLDYELEYKENVTTPNGNNDFLQYTLEQSRSGYSVHYATAATLMLRYFGIPSRYAEGYFLSAEEAANYQAGDSIILTEADAHAWPEIYLDGIGWIPFEVTPGYIDEEELEMAAQVVSNGLGEGIGKSYAGSSLTYQPPKQQENKQKISDLNSMFRFQIKHVISLLLILLLLLLLFFLCRILGKRRKLLKFLKQLKTAEDREAITEMFAYSHMLMETCHVTDDSFEEMKLINQKALFSGHEQESTVRKQMEAFMERIVQKCKRSQSFSKQLKYHYILWLYH